MLLSACFPKMLSKKEQKKVELSHFNENVEGDRIKNGLICFLLLPVPPFLLKAFPATHG